MKNPVKSSQVFDFIKENLDSLNILSAFVAGSVPKELLPQSDLDIVIIFKSKFKKDFFDNLINIMDKFLEDKSKIRYSFYNGPLKYRDEALIHFLIFTDVETEDHICFKHKNLFENFKKSYKMILGTPFARLMKDINFIKEQDRKLVLKKKYELLNKKNVVIFKSWVLKNGEWRFVKVYKRPSSFLRNHLIKYFKKYS